MARRNYKAPNAGTYALGDVDFDLVRAADAAARRLLSLSDSAFKVGELAIIQNPGCELDGNKVEVVCEYSLRRVKSRYEANRIEYQYGYMVRALGDKPVFCSAYLLRD